MASRSSMELQIKNTFFSIDPGHHPPSTTSTTTTTTTTTTTMERRKERVKTEFLLRSLPLITRLLRPIMAFRGISLLGMDSQCQNHLESSRQFSKLLILWPFTSVFVFCRTFVTFRLPRVFLNQLNTDERYALVFRFPKFPWYSWNVRDSIFKVWYLNAPMCEV